MTNPFVSRSQIAVGQVFCGADPADGQRAGEPAEHRLAGRRRASPSHVGVAMIPGETAFTRTGASSTASVRTSASTAPLTPRWQSRPASASLRRRRRRARSTADVGGLDSGERPPQLRLERVPGGVEVELLRRAARARDGRGDEVVDRARARRTSRTAAASVTSSDDAFSASMSARLGSRLAITTSQPGPRGVAREPMPDEPPRKTARIRTVAPRATAALVACAVRSRRS